MKNPMSFIALVPALVAALVTSAAPATAATFVAPYSPATGNAPVPGPLPLAVPPGLYVQVLDGAIFVKNAGGTQNFSAGQFGYTPSVTQPPVMVPSNPAIQFTPPPAFSSVNAPGSTNANGSAAKSNTVDCEVR